MADRITSANLAAAIAAELNSYHEDVNKAIDAKSEEAAKKLVKLTRATAPVGNRGSFKKNITSKQTEKTLNGSTYTWYVRPPDHRLTHLLVHGHATRDGGRTKGDPFLQNALDQVLPAYEQDIKEVLGNGK